ncbi:hypothetical protein A6R68_05924, partial [Neotoma lepida]
MGGILRSNEASRCNLKAKANKYKGFYRTAHKKQITCEATGTKTPWRQLATQAIRKKAPSTVGAWYCDTMKLDATRSPLNLSITNFSLASSRRNCSGLQNTSVLLKTAVCALQDISKMYLISLYLWAIHDQHTKLGALDAPSLEGAPGRSDDARRSTLGAAGTTLGAARTTLGGRCSRSLNATVLKAL